MSRAGVRGGSGSNLRVRLFALVACAAVAAASPPVRGEGVKVDEE